MKRLLVYAALLPLAPLLMAPAQRPDNTNPTPQQVAAASNPARAYADMVNVTVTLDLKELHPAVDLARLDCWTAAGQGGGGADSLAQLMAVYRAGPPAAGATAEQAMLYPRALQRLQQLASQGTYYQSTSSQQLPISGRAYHGTQTASFAILPAQLMDSKSRHYYDPPAFLTHCVVFLHDPTGMGNWRQALPALTQVEPATPSNFEFVTQGSTVEAYVLSALPKERAQETAGK